MAAPPQNVFSFLLMPAVYVSRSWIRHATIAEHAQDGLAEIMTEETNGSAPAPEGVSSGVDTRYLAYCDILGFSARILTDFENTLKSYREFSKQMSGPASNVKDVQTTMISDGIMMTGMSLDRVLVATQSLWFWALAHNFMIRGAITKGRYWEQRQGNHLFVVSDALVRAVRIEKSVGFPAVVIADDVEIPESYWVARFKPSGAFVTPLLHFRDRNIVNPFNLMWGQSARHRASLLMNEHPEHKDKYLWFIALYEAVAGGEQLVPPDVFKRFVEKGILQFKPLDAQEKPQT